MSLQKQGMTILKQSIDINAAKTKTWEVLADFDKLHWTKSVKDVRYTSSLRSSVGATRHCDLSDGGYIVERITHWNEGNGYVYAIDDARDPVSTDSYVEWSLKGNESHSRVTFEVTYRLKYGIIGKIMNALVAKKKFTHQISGFMLELKSHVESRNSPLKAC